MRPKRLPAVLSIVGIELHAILHDTSDIDLDQTLRQMCERHPAFARRMHIALARLHGALERQYFDPPVAAKQPRRPRTGGKRHPVICTTNP
jgi:hypothetical protein